MIRRANAAPPVFAGTPRRPGIDADTGRFVTGLLIAMAVSAALYAVLAAVWFLG